MEEIKAQLAYREENRNAVASFHITRTLGRQTKVLLDDEFEQWLQCAARIHRTPKAVLAREILMSWLLESVDDFKRDSRVA